MYKIDLEDGEMKSVLRLHTGKINAVRLNSKNNYIVTGGEDQIVRVWTTDSAELLFEFKLSS